MKNAILKYLALPLALLFVVVFTTTANTFEPGSSDFSSYFGSFSALIGGIPFVVEFIKRFLNIKSSLGIQIISWGTGVLMSFLAWALHLGMFENVFWWQSLAIGLGASLVANGVFDTGLITWLLRLLKVTK